MTYFVIGYGNTLRSDDGAGYYVAEAIAQWNDPHVRSHACHQLTPELADAIAQADEVIFVDAIAPTDAAPTELQIIHLTQEQAALSSEASVSSPDPVILSQESTLNLGHGLNPRSLLALAETLYGARVTAHWLLIPTETFDFGETVSPTTQRGMEQAIATIRRLCQD